MKLILTTAGAFVLSLLFKLTGHEIFNRNIGFALIVIALAMSGVLVSGDRMRANLATDGKLGIEKSYFLFPLCASIPFLVMYFLF